eukprot:sb/3478313/
MSVIRYIFKMPAETKARTLAPLGCCSCLSSARWSGRKNNDEGRVLFVEDGKEMDYSQFLDNTEGGMNYTAQELYGGAIPHLALRLDSSGEPKPTLYQLQLG